MFKLGRRQTLKLGTAAAIVGPSVMFSRLASADDTRGWDHIGAYNFKVEIDGVAAGLQEVRAVDLGAVEFGSKGLSFEDIKMELTKDVPGVFERGGWKLTKGAAHKISVSLYGRGGKTPAMTYHALGAVPHEHASKGKTTYLTWNVKEVNSESHKLGRSSGRLPKAPRKAFKIEVAGALVSAQAAHKFVWDHKEADAVQYKFDVAKKSWPSRGLKLAGKLEGNNESSAARDSSSLNFSKLDRAALESRDQFQLTTYVAAGRAPASQIFVKTMPAAMAGKSSSRFEVAPTKLKDKSTPALMLHFGSSPPKGKSRTALTDWANIKITLTTDEADIDVRLKSIEFPKLRRGSKALVTETLHFEGERKRR